MSDLRCPNCEPHDPIHGPEYYPIEQVVRERRDGVVDAESGNIRRSEHTYQSTIIYAECSQCGDVLLDNGIDGAEEGES